MKKWTSVLAFLLLVTPLSAVAEDLFFDSDGVKIRYIVEGEGEPLILIHGFSASLDSNFRMPGVIDAMKQNFKVIALDCRGHGKSDKPHDIDAYGTKMVDDVIRLMDHLEIEKAYVGGYSMGGFLTMKLLTMYPDRLVAAIPGGAGWPTNDSVGSDMREKLALSLENGNGIGPLMEALTPAGQPKPTAEQMAQINTLLMASNDQTALAAVIRSFAGLQVSAEQLKANEVPTLILIGEIDPLKASVDAAQAVMGNLEVVVLAGRDHMSAFADPGYTQNMTRFLQEHAPAGAGASTD